MDVFDWFYLGAPCSGSLLVLVAIIRLYLVSLRYTSHRSHSLLYLAHASRSRKR